MNHLCIKILCALALFAVLTGCTSIQTTSGQKEVKEIPEVLSSRKIKLKIQKIDLQTTILNGDPRATELYKNNFYSVTDVYSVMDKAIELYPDLFSRSSNSIPVTVNGQAMIDQNFSGEITSGMLCGLTIGLIPFPFSKENKINFTVKIGDYDVNTSRLMWKESVAMTLFSPLGLIAWGSSRLSTKRQFSASTLTTNENITTLLVWAIVDAVNQADKRQVELALYKYREQQSPTKEAPKTLLAANSSPPRPTPVVRPAVTTDLTRPGLEELKPDMSYSPTEGVFYAIVIGNDNYQDLPQLKSATHDAKAIAKILTREYSFKTTLLLNATEKDITMSFSKLRSRIKPEDSLLVYYAGHGWLDKEGDLGYWLPVDAEKNNEANWVSNAYITSISRAIQAKHMMIVADSCFSGKLTRGIRIERKSQGYLSRIASKKSRTVMTSGGVEPVLDAGGKNNHSVFASAFIDVLRENKGAIDANSIFIRVRRKVITNSDQTPEYSDIRKAGHDGGDFIFVKSKK